MRHKAARDGKEEREGTSLGMDDRGMMVILPLTQPGAPGLEIPPLVPRLFTFSGKCIKSWNKLDII
jgi:hypothetical protein